MTTSQKLAGTLWIPSPIGILLFKRKSCSSTRNIGPHRQRQHLAGGSGAKISIPYEESGLNPASNSTDAYQWYDITQLAFCCCIHSFGC